MKVYEIEFYGKKYHVVLEKGKYSNNGTLAIEMICTTPKGKYKEPFGMLTVNLDDSDVMANDTMAFIDTNNLGIEIIQWLTKNGIATHTQMMGFSGFCAYPLFKFNQSVLDEMKSMQQESPK